jgi:hypothetical protein
MPVLTVTNVNTTTEELTATAHGLLTGDRFRLRNVGGALPAATPSLAPVTDYFAIRSDADKIKVATSSSNALLGTAVNLTGAGTGTHFIEYGLPYCVPRIAAPGTQIVSADDNAQWNSLVALHGLFTGQAQSLWNAPGFATPTHHIPGMMGIDVAGVGHLRTGDGFRLDFTNQVIAVPIIVVMGMRLVSWTWWLNKQSNTSATLTAKLFRRSPDGNSTQVGADQTNAANGPGDITLGQTVNHLIVADNTYRVEVSSNGTAGNIGVDFTRGVKPVFDRSQV